jgi:hypothetical protein
LVHWNEYYDAKLEYAKMEMYSFAKVEPADCWWLWLYEIDGDLDTVALC